MKKQSARWGTVISRLLESGIGGMEGGFRVDETGHLVEDYAQTDGADDTEAYLAQLKRDGTLPAEPEEDDEEDLFALFGTPPAHPAEKEL